MQAVESGYERNPYHNSVHAADVVQALAWLLASDAFTRELTDLELLCIIMAAAVHDVGHPGELVCMGLEQEWGQMSTPRTGRGTVMSRHLVSSKGRAFGIVFWPALCLSARMKGTCLLC